MKKVIYFLEFVLVKFFFTIFKLIGYRSASSLGFFIGSRFGNIFRTKKSIIKNLEKSKILIKYDKNKFAQNVLGNYGRILAEYPFLKDFRYNKLEKYIEVDGKENLEKIKDGKKPVVFISGHFNNFELMAMQIEKIGIKIAAIYRPLNNIFLNQIMEKIRKNYICKYQIKKGIGGIKELVKLNNDGFSTALMIDQRVSEGVKSNFFNEKAFTTTIPAQLVKKYKIPVVPIFIERFDNVKFKITVVKPINFDENKSVEDITDHLNKILENFIKNKPNYWIWSHNRWK